MKSILKIAGAVVSCFMAVTQLANATSTLVDTSTQSSTGFDNNTTAPWFFFDYRPGYGTYSVVNFGGRPHCMKLYWPATSWDGTRAGKGIEFGGNAVTYKEGWFGFLFYLPSPGYPKNEGNTIYQVFQNGNCNSWAMLVGVNNGSLTLDYRSSCGTPVHVDLAGIQYNAWKPLVVHFVASHLNAGLVEVYYNGSKIYSATSINFGFGTWNSNDTLASGNQLGIAGGQYNSGGVDKTVYFDNICHLMGNPSGAYNTVNPGNGSNN